MAADPALEARMMRITAELRCLVCQNQTIADSHADLAVDLRRADRASMLQRRARATREIVDYMTARYGDFVLYRPPLKATTALLWFGPALMLAGRRGGARARAAPAQPRSAADAFEADDDERARRRRAPIRPRQSQRRRP